MAASSGDDVPTQFAALLGRHADVKANCFVVGEVAAMLSHLPYARYQNERPLLLHPLQIQHLPPIRRAIARMRRKARKNKSLGDSMV